jgi:hypothetical protein
MGENGSQFTRATWRASRKRATTPRQRDYGGQTQAPLGLLAHRAKPGRFGNVELPKCAHCKRPAIRGVGVCRWHNGVRAVKALGRSLTPTARRAARNALDET